MMLRSTLFALTLATAPAFAQVPASPAAPAAAAARFTLDTPIETILADPSGKAALESALPGIGSHPALDMFKSMSLKQVAPYSEGMLTAERLAKAEAALAGVK